MASHRTSHVILAVSKLGHAGTFGPSDVRTFGRSDLRTFGPSDPRTLGPSDLRGLRLTKSCSQSAYPLRTVDMACRIQYDSTSTARIPWQARSRSQDGQ